MEYSESKVEMEMESEPPMRSPPVAESKSEDVSDSKYDDEVVGAELDEVAAPVAEETS